MCMRKCAKNACTQASQNAQERLWTSPSRTPARMHASPHTPGQQKIAPGLAPPSGAPNATCQQAPRAVHGVVFWSQCLTFEHSKKRWKMVLIYSQHIWLFFVFFWGDVSVSSLFISRPGQTVVTNFIYNIQLYIMCAGVTWRWGWWCCFQGEEMQYMMLL